MMTFQDSENVPGGRVTAFDPNDFGWITLHHAAFIEVGIARDDNETIVPGVAPDGVIVGALHPHETHMGGSGIQIVQRLNQAIGKVLVEEELQARLLAS